LALGVDALHKVIVEDAELLTALAASLGKGMPVTQLPVNLSDGKDTQRGKEGLLRR